MDLKLPYGLKNDKLIHIKELDKDQSGLACNCFCPNCNSQLIARMGNKRVNHFAHYNSNCSYSVESTLHFLAKEILEKRCELRIPKVVANYKGKDYLLIQEKTLKFDRVILEKQEGDIIPDIICFVGDEKIYVEIAVTHYVNDEKLNKIENKDITTLEIDLSSLWEESTNEDFMKATEKKNVENLIIDTTANKKWVFHADINKFLNNLIIEEERLIKEKEEKYNSIYEFVLEVLKEEKKIILPSVKTNDTKPKLLYKEKIINFDRINLLTKNADSIQLVCIKGTRKLYMEVYLGHISNNKFDNYFSFINNKYQEYYKNKNSAIMIDLRRLIKQDNFILNDQNKLELKQEILFKNSYKKWIYNYKSVKKEQELLNNQEKKVKEKKN